MRNDRPIFASPLSLLALAVIVILFLFVGAKSFGFRYSDADALEIGRAAKKINVWQKNLTKEAVFAALGIDSLQLGEGHTTDPCLGCRKRTRWQLSRNHDIEVEESWTFMEVFPSEVNPWVSWVRVVRRQ